jgi:hypothetical protein
MSVFLSSLFPGSSVHIFQHLAVICEECPLGIPTEKQPENVGKVVLRDVHNPGKNEGRWWLAERSYWSPFTSKFFTLHATEAATFIAWLPRKLFLSLCFPWKYSKSR